MERHLILYLVTLLVINTVLAQEPATISMSFSGDDFKAFASALNSRTFIARTESLKGFDIRNGIEPKKDRIPITPLEFVDHIFQKVEELYSQNNIKQRGEAIKALTDIKSNFGNKTKNLADEYLDMVVRVRKVCKSIKAQIAKFLPIKNFDAEVLLNMFEMPDQLANVCRLLRYETRSVKYFTFKFADFSPNGLLHEFIGSSTEDEVKKLLIEIPNYNSLIIKSGSFSTIKERIEEAKDLVRDKLKILHKNIQSQEFKTAQPKQQVSAQDISRSMHLLQGKFAKLTNQHLEILWDSFTNLNASLLEMSQILKIHSTNITKFEESKLDFLKNFSDALNDLKGYTNIAAKIERDLTHAIKYLNKSATDLLDSSAKIKKIIDDDNNTENIEEKKAKIDVNNHLARYMQRLAGRMVRVASPDHFQGFTIKPFNWLLARESLKYAVNEAHNFFSQSDKFTEDITIDKFEITIAGMSPYAGKKYDIEMVPCKVFGAYTLTQLPHSPFGKVDAIRDAKNYSSSFLTKVYSPFTDQRITIFKSPYNFEVTVSPAALKFMEQSKMEGRNLKEFACDIGIYGNGKADIVLHLLNDLKKPSKTQI